jgi:hypothetical protein
MPKLLSVQDGMGNTIATISGRQVLNETTSPSTKLGKVAWDSVNRIDVCCIWPLILIKETSGSSIIQDFQEFPRCGLFCSVLDSKLVHQMVGLTLKDPGPSLSLGFGLEEAKKDLEIGMIWYSECLQQRLSIILEKLGTSLLMLQRRSSRKPQQHFTWSQLGWATSEQGCGTFLNWLGRLKLETCTKMTSFAASPAPHEDN